MASRSPSSSPDTATGSGTDPARPDTGEPLGGAGSDSDSDIGLGKFDCREMEAGERLEGEDLEREFESAAERVGGLVQTASRDQLLYLYARYKQVRVGKCNTTKPGFFDFEGQRKWQAWKQLGDMEAEKAMREYISCVNVLDPDGCQRERRGAERRTGFGGAAVSSLYQEETIREEDKNIFDYCRENNIEHVTKAINTEKVDVNSKDEEGRALLHWACDRGHKELVSVLLQHKADINSQVEIPNLPLDTPISCKVAMEISSRSSGVKRPSVCGPEELRAITKVRKPRQVRCGLTQHGNNARKETQ
ncbi:acyl-CoA-binding domain-containing protein 6 isoform X2 [Synchiropus splendidus]|uniref:acyl-CoA-binding domain-containing protein 6 isoform X2 n=1 Tax=Synchiropus splendidus TaxID=270530 RepID=UPI00237EAF2E|nr:acyl-CoA-binding domain-containing protein 6 isoform X2 [Synchiropus splendidus]